MSSQGSGMRWVAGPRRWLLVAATVVLAVVGAVVGAFVEGPAGAVLGALVGVLASAVLPWWRERQDTADRRAGIVRAVTATATGDGAAVTLVRDTQARFMHQRRQRVEVDYLARDAEREARSALEAGKPVLLVGDSMAGKSTLAEHLVRELYPDLPLWTPRPERLPTLLEAGTLTGAVLALDDLDRYLDVAGLPTDWVEPTRQGGAVIIGTIRSTAYDRLATGGQVAHPQRADLERFTIVRVRDDDVAENDRLAGAFADPAQRAAVRRVGLGAFLGGGPQARERYENNRAAQPWGCALVQAAADWRRIGLTQISPAELAKLAAAYVPARYRHDPAADTEAALRWATERTRDGVQLLEHVPDGRVVCSDYILDYLTRSDAPVPDTVWGAAIVSLSATPGEILGLGVIAHQSGRPHDARAAFERVTNVGDRDQAPMAWFNLGLLEQQEGRLDAARDAYQHAIDSDHPEAGLAAWVGLGLLEREDGRLDAARDAYQHAIDSDHPEAGPAAWVGLGQLLEREDGRLDAARDAYQHAIDSGHPKAAHLAADALHRLDDE